MPDTYIPSDIQTGLPDNVPLKIELDTDTRLNNLFNPALTKEDVPGPVTDFSDFFNSSSRVQNSLPKGVSLYDAFFSPDPKIKGLANNIIEAKNDGDLFKKLNLGTDIKTPYDQAAKYLDEAFGYDFRRNNEDFYAQYKNAGVSGVVENAAKFVGRTVGSAFAKLGEGASGLLAMGIAPFQSGKFWSNVADNALVQWFDNADKTIKDDWMPVYQDAAASKKGFFGRMFTDNTFWTSDFADGLAFMLSAALPGVGLSKIGLAARLGAEAATAARLAGGSAEAIAAAQAGGDAAQLFNLGRLGKLTAGGVDRLLTTTLNTASEAFFEAKGVHDSIIKKYSDFSQKDANGTLLQDPNEMIKLPDGSIKRAANLSDNDKEAIAAHGARNDFMANFPILIFSNAWETKMLYKVLGKGGKPSTIGSTEFGKGLELEVKQASTKLGKLWEGKVGFYTRRGAEGIFWEGLWEENAQLAAQRLNDDSVKFDSGDGLTNFFKQLKIQTTNAMRDADDPLYDKEAASSIGLGALIGVLGGVGISALSGEHRSEKNQNANAVAVLNQLKNNFLTGDIFLKDEKGEPILKNGLPQVDDNKIKLRADQTNSLAEKARIVEKLTNPDLREAESKKMFVPYVQAMIAAGKENSLVGRLGELATYTPQEIVKLGFDPSQQLGSPTDYKQFAQELIDLHNKVSKMDLGKAPKGTDAASFAIQNMDRRSAIYTNKAYASIYNNFGERALKDLTSLREQNTTPELSSLSDLYVNQYNNLKLRRIINDASIADSKDDVKRISALEEINRTLDEQMYNIEAWEPNQEIIKNLKKDKDGFYNYEKDELNAKLDPFLKNEMFVASHRNLEDYHNIIADKIADPEKGSNYHKDTLVATANEIIQDDIKRKKEAVVTPEVVIPAPGTLDVVADTVKTGYRVDQVDEEYRIINPQGDLESTFPTQEAATQEVIRLNKEAIAANIADQMKGGVPLIQDEEEVTVLNRELNQQIQEEVNEGVQVGGKRITDSLSVASKSVLTQENGFSPLFDEQGRPMFNYNQENIIDFGVIIPDTKLTLRYNRNVSTGDTYDDGSKRVKYEEGNITEANSENAVISVYYKDKANVEHRIGDLHTKEGARTHLPENISPEELAVQLKRIVDTRNLILASPDKDFIVTVRKTGFGFMNKGNSSSYKTISEATGSDPNVILAVKKGDAFETGHGTPLSTKYAENVGAGADVILVPNNFNGNDILVPIYIIKKQVATDPEIAQIVKNDLLSYYETGNKSDLSDIRDWVFITEKPVLGSQLTNNGLFMNDKGEIFYRGGNIRGLHENIEEAINIVISKLQVNINASRLNSPPYTHRVLNSPAFLTNIFPVEREGKKSYFHQHTIVIDPPSVAKTAAKKGKKKAGDVIATPVVVTPTTITTPVARAREIMAGDSITNTSKSYLQSIAKEGTDQDIIDALKDIAEQANDTPSAALAEKSFGKELIDIAKGQFINPTNTKAATDKKIKDMGFDEASFDIQLSTVQTIASQPSRLLIPGFSSFVQEDAITSIAYLALTNTYNTSNEAFGQAALSSQKTIENKEGVKVQLQNKLAEWQDVALTVDEARLPRVQSIITNLQLAIDHYDEIFTLAQDRLKSLGISPDVDTYYQDVAEYTSEFFRFDDDSELQRDNFDSLSQLVKQFISFNPDKVERDGTIYNKPNALGLPYIANAKYNYNLIINKLTETYNYASPQGFQDMLDKLSKEENNPTVKAIAQRLKDSNNFQLKMQFFTNMNKFKTDHTQQLTSINKSGVHVRNIEANRGQMARVVMEEMEDSFNVNSPVMDQTMDQEGNSIFRINPIKATPVVVSINAIVDDKNSFVPRTYDDGTPTGGSYMRKEPMENIYRLLTTGLGFDFSYATFKTLLNSKTANNSKRDARRAMNNYFTGGNKVLDLLVNPSEPGTVDTRSPFLGAASSEMLKIARIESNYRVVTKSDSFRSNGKTYYPFTRMSFVKSIFQQMESLSQNIVSDMMKDFARDPFKSKSRILAGIKAGNTFIPEMWFARGVKDRKGNDINTEIKNTNDKEFILSKLHAYQNQGSNLAFFYSDTYSDKTTRFQIKDQKQNVDIVFDAEGNPSLDNKTLELFYNYFLAEHDRIQNVLYVNKNVDDSLKISDFHDIGDKEGLGKYFVIFPYLNKYVLSTEAASQLYDENGELKPITDETKSLVLDQINKFTILSINRYQKSLEKAGLFTNEKGQYSSKGLNDADYYEKLSAKFQGTSYSEQIKAKIVTADYLLNDSLNSLEMLTLTGDPAMSPKVIRTKGKIDLISSIPATHTEASKRNASLNAPFDQGPSIDATYQTIFMQDVKIQSQHLGEYIKLLGRDKAAAYGSDSAASDKTDAQEMNTVKFHLSKLLSLGRLDPEVFVQAFVRFDPKDFAKHKEDLQSKFNELGIAYNLDNAREDGKGKNFTGLLQPFKPVQRYSRWEEDLGQIVETYIKTSSYPIVPELVAGTHFESYLNQMQENDIDTLNFKSGTKQGVINPQSLYDGENPNPNIITTNIAELDSAAWGEQVLNPEKEENIVTEGSQQQRLVMVDLHDNEDLVYKGQPIKAGALKEEYRKLHQIIFNIKVQDLFNELNVSSVEGINNFTTFEKLSQIIQDEGIKRNYDGNTLQALKLNEKGKFYIPLTYLPNSSQIQQLIAAIISNRILKNKLPGKSFIQGSEVILENSQGRVSKVRITSDINEAALYSNNRDKRAILWTKPEYQHLSKLKYLREDSKTGEILPAQIILPFFFRGKDNKLLKASDFMNSQGFLDTTKIDPELLEINGFRIPYAGLNSGMWFEVVGFMPEYMGDLVIVPAEIAAQMGADYDVDKLFTYIMNHTASTDKGIRIDNSTERKEAENGIIATHKAVYLHKGNMKNVLDPTSTVDIEKGIAALKAIIPAERKEIITIFDPENQDKVWLSNRAAQAAVGIFANYNTGHAAAQQANLFTKGIGIKFKDENGKVFNDDYEDATSDISSEIYSYHTEDDEANSVDEFEGINRLDKIHTITGSGERKTISSIIGSWIQAALDNAKLQVLGQGGLNRFNLNVAATILSHGFDSEWAIKFINQPILKDYYVSSDDLNDRFNRNFSTSKKDDVFEALKSKYLAKAGLDTYDALNYAPQSMSDLNEGIKFGSFEKLSPEGAANQLEILKQFMRITDISKALSSLSGNTKIEVSGLPKSFSEITDQAIEIEELEKSNILGNIENIRTQTISGLYLSVPSMINTLFNAHEDPVFAYSSKTYRDIKSKIQGIAGRPLTAEQTDDLYKSFKQFTYTHPDFNLYENLSQVKNDLLFDSDESPSLVSLLKVLQQAYPQSTLLGQLSWSTKKNPKDPDILTMNNSDVDIAIQMKQDWFDFFRATDPRLVTFANKLSTYALLLANKEFGPSTLIKNIPFEVLTGIGFGEKLNEINGLLEDTDLFHNFIRQVVQHNSSYAKFISVNNIPENVLYQQFQGRPTSIPAEFTMEEPTADFLVEHPEYNSITIPSGPQDRDSFEYKPYIRTYVNDYVGQTLYELQSDGLTYRRIDTLGNENISEYDFHNENVKSVFPVQRAHKASDMAGGVASNEQDEVSLYVSHDTAKDVFIEVMTQNAREDASPREQMFYELAKNLMEGSTADIDFSRTSPTGTMAGRYTGGTTNRIDIFLDYIKEIPGNFKENLQRTILHEGIHSKMDPYVTAQMKLPESQQSPEFKRLTKVWNAYKKNFITDNSQTTVRGIKDSFLSAELFKALYNNEIANNQGASKAVTVDAVFNKWATIKENRQALLELVYDMQTSMAKAYQDGVGEQANFDLVKKVGDTFEPIDTQRVAQIMNFLDDNFSKQKFSELRDKYYAYVNVKEFNTMTLTDVPFMNHLNSIKGLDNSPKSLWENFKDIVKRIVSLFSNNSLLSNAIDAVLDIHNMISEIVTGIRTIPEVVEGPMIKEDTSEKITQGVSNQSEKMGNIKMQPDNVDKIKAGTKTITNRTTKLANGVYAIPDGTKIVMNLLGKGKYSLQDKTDDTSGIIEIGAPLNEDWELDDFAKGEGFRDWNDFKTNNKFSDNFINGKQSRYVYSIRLSTPSDDVSLSIDGIFNNLMNSNQIQQICD